MHPSTAPLAPSFPPQGWVAHVRNGNDGPVVISKQPESAGGPSHRQPLQGRGVIVQNSGPGPSQYIRIEQNRTQRCLDNGCCQCLFPSAKLDKCGNAVCCTLCTGFCSTPTGGPFSGCIGQCCALKCYNCCGCDTMTNCGPRVSDDSCCFSWPCVTRQPNAYHPYVPEPQAAAVQLLERQAKQD